MPVDTGLVRRPFLLEPDTGLTLFGRNAFRGRTTLFQPVLPGPVPPTYKVGPGDVMVLVITGGVEFVHQLTVTREGSIVIPQVGVFFAIATGPMSTGVRKQGLLTKLHSCVAARTPRQAPGAPGTDCRPLALHEHGCRDRG